MILRRSLLRHSKYDAIILAFAHRCIDCRISLTKPQTWKRPLATEVDLESRQQFTDAIDQEVKGAALETKSIDSQMQDLDNGDDFYTRSRQALLQDGTAEAYKMRRRNRQSPKS